VRYLSAVARFAFFVFALLVACGGDETLFGSGRQSSRSTASSGGEGGSGDGGQGGVAGGTTTTTSSVTTGGGEGGSSLDCPPAPNDNACTACVKEQCCPQAQACAVDRNCTCWIDCINNGDPGTDCANICGGWGTSWSNLFACSQTACPLQC
jgi:hypothetical protein